MSETLQSTVRDTVRDTVPFLVSMVIWGIIMLAVYGLFLVSIPAEASYGPAVHTSVFVPPLVGFVGHVLREALKGRA